MATTYLDSLLTPKSFKGSANNLLKMITKSKVKFDGIACTGSSGIMIAPYIASLLNKKIILVRKEKSHSFSLVEYVGTPKKYIIIDDFIESGKTIINIIESIKEDDYLQYSKPVGIFLYASFCDENDISCYSGYNTILEEYKIPIYNVSYLKTGKFLK